MIVANTNEEFIEYAKTNSFAINNENNAQGIIWEYFSEKLSLIDVVEFLTTCKFKNGILCHCKYDLLYHKLERNDFILFFNLFGISNELFSNWKDYYCRGASGCYANQGWICTSYCGKE